MGVPSKPLNDEKAQANVPVTETVETPVKTQEEKHSTFNDVGNALNAGNDLYHGTQELIEDSKKDTTIDPNPISVGTITRIAVSIVVLANLVFYMFGSDKHLDENMVYAGVSTLAPVLNTAWVFWKNNDITKKARKKAKISEKHLNK